MKRNILLLLSALLMSASLMAEDVIYCRGGLVGTSDWGISTLYPLRKNENGIFVGTVEMVSRTELRSGDGYWGNRVDLFFDMNNEDSNFFGCATNTGRFITPGKTDWVKIDNNRNNVFQCGGGKYTVYLDLENMQARFEAIEPAFLSEVSVVGDLEGASWNRDGRQYQLMHQGDGVYTGEITVVDSGDGLGYFSIFASYVSNDMTEGRYSSSTPNLRLYPGVTDPCDRYYGQRSWSVEPGTYNVTFDLSHETIRINLPSEPDLQVSRAYVELGLAIEEAMDAWPGLDLSAVTSVYENPESTEEELSAAISSIPDLIKAYVLNQMETKADAGSPVDATYLVINHDCSSRNGWRGTSVSFSSQILSASNMDFNIYQSLTDLPNGIYRVNVKGVSRYGAGAVYYTNPESVSLDKKTVYIYGTASGVKNSTHVTDIYDNKFDALNVEGEQDFTGEGWYAPYDLASAKAYIEDGRYDENEVYVYVNDGTLTFGARHDDHQKDDAFYADDWTLTYYGNTLNSFALFAEKMAESNQGFEDIPAEAAAKDAFETALAAAAGLNNENDVVDAYVALVNSYAALDASQIAYALYQNKLAEAKKFLEENESLSSIATAKLQGYLTENEAPGTYENGSSLYILENGNLNSEQIAAEMDLVDTMMENALKGEILAGTDITALFQNMGMTETNFAGWQESHNEGSFASGNGLISNPVGGWYNFTNMSMYQTLTDLPNGIYAFSMNAFYRTGSPETASSEDVMSTFLVVNEYHTPMLGVYDDALSEGSAVIGENCYEDDYSTGDVRFPNSVSGASQAFLANRYYQTAYGVVSDGTLTIGVVCDGFPNYNGDWCIMSNLKVVYLGKDEEAASAMVESMSTRAENMLASTLNYRSEIREAMDVALNTSVSDFSTKVEKASALNHSANEAIASAQSYSALEIAVDRLYNYMKNAFDAGYLSDERYETYSNLYETVINKVFEGSYTDGEAASLAEEYGALADKYMPLRARGGLQNVGNWALTYTYPLYLNEDGWYEGVVKFVDSSDQSPSNSWWGSRGDLFFTDEFGNNYGCEKNIDHFITPAHNGPFKIVNSGNSNPSSPFQAIGGDYKVLLNLETMEAKFECVREFWMDSVYCIGTLKDVKAWDCNNYRYSLKHTENGIYKGVIVVESSGDELGQFSVMTSYNSGSTEGRYGSAGEVELKAGEKVDVYRTNTSSKWSIAPGEWIVTFDMNSNTIRVNTLDAPDYEIESGDDDDQTDKLPIYAAGGLMDTGNWEKTNKYPLYKNKDGIYEGEVVFTDLTLNLDDTRWGNRSDLFFFDTYGQLYGAASSLNNDEKFITPARNHAYPLGLGNSNVFQTVAGTYKVFLDTDKMEVRFESIEEKWLEQVYAVGTIVGWRWAKGVAGDGRNVLSHVGHGVYQGIINLEEDNSTLGTFAVVTSYVNNNDSEGRYSPTTDKQKVEVGGDALPVYRLNNSKLSIAAEVGEVLVTFDMNHGTVKLNDPNDPDGIEAIGLTNMPKHNVPVGIYKLNGQKVYSGMSQWNIAQPGVYIMVTGDTVRKVLVR